MNEKQIVKPLLKYIDTRHLDHIETWNDWLRWLCSNLDWSMICRSNGYVERFEEMKKDNPEYFEAMIGWFEYATEQLKLTNGAFDAFGTIYESNFQSQYKASKSGQFFTPMSLCIATAEITSVRLKEATEEVLLCYDPAVGSGRMPLASWGMADKCNRILFVAGDIDTSSVNMCALNFMIAGMVGCVEKKDALTKKWYGAYIVNAGKVPFWNESATLQWFDDQEEFAAAWSRLEELAKSWDCVNYRKK